MKTALHTFMGMRVIVNPMLDDVPRMQTTPRFADLMPPEFTAELNAWMREFFGTTNDVIRLGQGAVVMGPKTYAALLIGEPA